jgi:hypothetical protein
VRYIYLNCIRREMYLIWRDTCGIHAGYMRDTCILGGNQDTCWTHARYMRDTCGIHAGYMQDTYLGGWGNVSMPSSCQSDRYKCILMYLDVSWCILMYLDRTHRNTCKIHAGYMQDTLGYVLYSLPPPLRKHRIKKLRQAKVPWGSKKTAHG